MPPIFSSGAWVFPQGFSGDFSVFTAGSFFGFFVEFFRTVVVGYTTTKKWQKKSPQRLGCGLILTWRAV
jgi:hypothetical protein